MNRTILRINYEHRKNDHYVLEVTGPSVRQMARALSDSYRGEPTHVVVERMRTEPFLVIKPAWERMPGVTCRMQDSRIRWGTWKLRLHRGKMGAVETGWVCHQGHGDSFILVFIPDEFLA